MENLDSSEDFFSGFEVLIQNIVRENNIKRSLIQRKKLQLQELEKDIAQKQERIKSLNDQADSKRAQHSQLLATTGISQSNIERLRQNLKLMDEHQSSLKRQIKLRQLESGQRFETLKELSGQIGELVAKNKELYLSSKLCAKVRDMKLAWTSLQNLTNRTEEAAVEPRDAGADKQVDTRHARTVTDTGCSLTVPPPDVNPTATDPQLKSQPANYDVKDEKITVTADQHQKRDPVVRKQQQPPALSTRCGTYKLEATGASEEDIIECNTTARRSPVSDKTVVSEELNESITSPYFQHKGDTTPADTTNNDTMAFDLFTSKRSSGGQSSTFNFFDYEEEPVGKSTNLFPWQMGSTRDDDDDDDNADGGSHGDMAEGDDDGGASDFLRNLFGSKKCSTAFKHPASRSDDDVGDLLF